MKTAETCVLSGSAMKTEFDSETHIGKVDGVVWPSVTQLLQEFKLIDYSMVPFEILERKRLIGVRVGLAANLLDECRLDREHFDKSFPECIPYLQAYEKFRLYENFEPEKKEIRLFSTKWRCHGAPDELGVRIGNFGGISTLIDYKCTFKMFDSTGPQLAAYSMLIEECLGIKVKKRFGLLLRPTGSYDLFPFNDKSDFTDFQMCVCLHWRLREKYHTSKGVDL